MKTACRVMALILSVGGLSFAAMQADTHVAVYSSGFLVDTHRQETYGDALRRVQIKTQAKGTAEGETPDSVIEIDRVSQGFQWRLDPASKTYTEVKYQKALEDNTPASGPEPSSRPAPTLHISKIDPTVSGPLGSDTINGFPAQSYTIRIVADFSNPQTGKVVATETMLEKLWVTDKAPKIVNYRKAESDFNDSLTAVYGTETASFRWLLREFNRHILEINGNTDDFKSLQTTYQGARASIKGVTVRQLAGWNWRPKDASAPGADAVDDVNSFIGSIAAGLGAPPDAEGKTPLKDSEKPRWVQDLEKDLGRQGPTAMTLNEVLRTRNVKVSPDFFEIPADYRKQ